jgi:hypothetical protein
MMENSAIKRQSGNERENLRRNSSRGGQRRRQIATLLMRRKRAHSACLEVYNSKLHLTDSESSPG